MCEKKELWSQSPWRVETESSRLKQKQLIQIESGDIIKIETTKKQMSGAN